jgi:hypothetical protein
MTTDLGHRLPSSEQRLSKDRNHGPLISGFGVRVPDGAPHPRSQPRRDLHGKIDPWFIHGFIRRLLTRDGLQDSGRPGRTLAPTEVVISRHRHLRVAELVGGGAGRQTSLVHQRGNGPSQGVRRDLPEAGAVEGLPQVTLRIARISQLPLDGREDNAPLVGLKRPQPAT